MSESNKYVALDVGTSSVKILMGQVHKDESHIIGVGEVPTKGMKKGVIVDMDATVQSIKQAVEHLERVTNEKVPDVILGVPAIDLQLLLTNGVVAVNSEEGEITDAELNRVLDSAALASIGKDRELMNVLGEEYIVDEYDEITDPRGMIGRRLEVKGKVITSPRTLVHNLVRCVNNAGIEIREMYAQPLVTGNYVLTNDEKERSSAIVDIGGGTTTVSYYEYGRLMGSRVIPVGGDNITKDISIILKTSMEEAKRLKVEYGHTFVDEASDETFDVKIIGSDVVESYSQKFLAEIISARMEELYELIMDELFNLSVRDLNGGIIFTGGTAQLNGLLQHTKEVFQTRVRIHIPTEIGVREPMYSTALGLIHYASEEDLFFNRVSDEMIYSQAPVAGHQEQQATTVEPKKEKKPKESLLEKTKKIFNSFLD